MRFFAFFFVGCEAFVLSRKGEKVTVLFIILLLGCAQTEPIKKQSTGAHIERYEAVDPQQTTLINQAETFKENNPKLFGKAHGVLILAILPGGQGEKIGLKPGDILQTYDNISLNSHEHLIELTRKTKENRSITLTYFRNKALHKIDIKGGKLGIEITSLISSQSKSLTQQMSDLIARGNGELKAAQYEKAMQSYQSGLKIAKDAKNQIWIKEFGEKLGLMYRDLSQYPNAKDYFEKSLSIAREIGGYPLETINLIILSDAHLEISQYQKALDYSQQALVVARNIGNRHLEMYSFTSLGYVYVEINQYPRALDHFQKALAIARVIDDRSAMDIMIQLGDLYVKIGQYSKALDHYQQALAIAHDMDDRRSVMRSMNGIGVVYRSLSQYQKALAQHRQVLDIARKIDDRSGEIISLGNMGEIYRELGQYSEALDNLQQALTISREIDNRTYVSNTLNNLGNVYLGLGQYQEALDYFQQALTISREIGNRYISARAMANLGVVYRRFGQYQEALDYYQQALTISREIGDRANVATILNNLGYVYRELGQNPKALDYYQQALAIVRDIGDRHNSAKAMVNLGVINRNLGRYSEALDYYQQALAIAREIGDRSLVAVILINLGTLHQVHSQHQEALDHFQQALVIAREIGNRNVIERALSNQGVIYGTLGKYSEALNKSHQALAIALSNDSPDSIWETWMNFSEIRYKVGQFDTAIAAGKLAVNALQSRRAGNVRLEQYLQDSFLSDNAMVHYHLAKMLIEQNRFIEAEQVMAMLKEKEYFDFTQRDSQEDKREIQVSYTSIEEAITARINQFNNQLVLKGKEYESLKKLDHIDERSKVRLTEVENELEQAQANFHNLLSNLDNYFKGSDKTLEFGERQIRQLESQQGMLREHQAVIITTIATEKKLYLLLTTPEVQLVRESTIDKKTLNNLIMRFRERLKDPKQDAISLAQELYIFLVKPIEKDLQQAQIKTLMWSLDGALRYIPLATLHDGQKFLIEKYSMSVYTPAAHNNLHRKYGSLWRAAGLGVSQAHHEFKALPAVPKELKDIIRENDGDRGALLGKIYLDKAFNRETFKLVARERYPVLHIASHFKLQPGNSSSSKLLLGDGKTLSLDEFHRHPDFRLHDVTLLTLSACDTAMGSEGTGKEVESFAAIAQSRGASSVLASLWQVADGSTALLMQRFYRLLSGDGSLSKAEALRQTQIKFIRGEIPDASNSLKFNHPYFWAPFIMMGNWL